MATCGAGPYALLQLTLDTNKDAQDPLIFNSMAQPRFPGDTLIERPSGITGIFLSGTAYEEFVAAQG